MKRSAEKIRVLIVEDHLMVAEMGRYYLAQHEDMEVVGCVATSKEALEVLQSRDADVVLMDYSLPDGDGITAAAMVRNRFPQTQVIIVTGSAEPRLVTEALRAGCAGFLHKSDDVRKLAAYVRAAYWGTTAISLETLSRVQGQPATTPGREATAALNSREVEVLQLLAEGLNIDDIAQKLLLTSASVRSRIKTVLDKLQVPSQMDAVSVAVREGAVKLAGC